ncbi:type III-B CRISPR-associated protein Cas10/Cmr2 [Xylanibacter muris]
MKSFWAASYFMSYIGKSLVTDVYKAGRKFLKPLLSDKMFDIKDGVGRFPDQYVFIAEKDDYEGLLRKRDEVFHTLAIDIAATLNGKYGKADICQYLKETIKIYICEINDMKPDENAVDKCQGYLAGMECMDIYPVTEEHNYLAEYFENINKSCLLIKDAFGIGNAKGERIFDTLIEMSANEAVEKQLITIEDLLLDSSKVSELMPRYKYVAYISADGDNVGKAISKLGTELSSRLLSFNIKIRESVENAGGRLIYAGGDDILFIAPVSSVFQLIKDTDEAFNNEMEQIKDMLKQNGLDVPTLSYGVSIAYYKHPMREAMELSEELLGKAKDSGRNRICWNMRKHSGQSVGSVFAKENMDVFNKALEIMSFFGYTGDNGLFLHSFSHYLLLHKDMISDVLANENSKQQLENYIKATFDDDSHTDHTEIIKKFHEFMIISSCTYPDGNKGKSIELLHALLRYVELIISKN